MIEKVCNECELRMEVKKVKMKTELTPTYELFLD